jgi:hypothetical protein
MVFEKIPTVLMVSLVLDLFVCTLAAGPKAVIVASCVYIFLRISRSSQKVVKCFNGYRVIKSFQITATTD